MRALLAWLAARPLHTALAAAALLSLHAPAPLVLGGALLLLALLSKGRAALAWPIGLGVVLTWLIDVLLRGQPPLSASLGGGQPLLPWEWPFALALLCAALLYSGQSWNVVLGIQLLLVAGSYLLMLRNIPEALQMEAARISELVGELWLNAGIAQAPPNLDASVLAALLAASAGLTAMLCLMLARYWQSLLYNPGGFGGEFQRLRLPLWLLLPLCLAWLVAAQQARHEWLGLLSPTLLVASAALAHGVVAAGRLSGAWLALHYGIILGAPALAVLAVALDGVFDFRKRLGQRWQNAESPRDKPDNGGPDTQI